MPVIPITVFTSLGLVFLFVALFWREQRRSGASAERDSLLPLADEQPRVQPAAGRSGAAAAPLVPGAGPAAEAEDDPDHGPGACGCRDGRLPACATCLRRPATA